MLRHIRILFAFAAVAVFAGAAFACGDDTAPATTAPTTAGAPGLLTVDVADDNFTPSNLTVQAGSTVTWDWSGTNPHSVLGQFDGADVNSGIMMGGDAEFEFTFAKGGTFDYMCGVHGAAMSGRVTVRE